MNDLWLQGLLQLLKYNRFLRLIEDGICEFVFNCLLPEIVSVANINFDFHSQIPESLITLFCSSKSDNINPLTGSHIHIPRIMSCLVLMICCLAKLFALFFVCFVVVVVLGCCCCCSVMSL